MKNRSARPWARSQDQDAVPRIPLPFSGLLFYEIFIDELWFLFAALHVTLYAAVLFAISPSYPHMHTYTSFLWANLIILK